MNNEHYRICDKILLYLYKELEGEELNQFKEHLIDCKDCQNKIKEMTKIKNMYEQIQQVLPEEMPSYEIVNRIMQMAKKRRSVNIHKRLVLTGALATVILTFVFVFTKNDKDKINSLQLEEPSYILIDSKIENRINETNKKVNNLLEELKEGG